MVDLNDSIFCCKAVLIENPLLTNLLVKVAVVVLVEGETKDFQFGFCLLLKQANRTWENYWQKLFIYKWVVWFFFKFYKSVIVLQSLQVVGTGLELFRILPLFGFVKLLCDAIDSNIKSKVTVLLIVCLVIDIMRCGEYYIFGDEYSTAS